MEKLTSLFGFLSRPLDFAMVVTSVVIKGAIIQVSGRIVKDTEITPRHSKGIRIPVENLGIQIGSECNTLVS